MISSRRTFIIEPDEKQVAQKIGHDWRNPETYHPDDGSVVDW